MLFSTENVANTSRLMTSLMYSHKFNWWKPSVELYFNKQWLNYKGRDYNNPMYSFHFNNRFYLPKDYAVIVDMWGDKMGHSGEVIVGDNFVTNVGINKNFLKNQLNVNLTFRNIFKTSRQNMEAHIGNVDFYKWNGNDHFGVRFQCHTTSIPPPVSIKVKVPPRKKEGDYNYSLNKFFYL